MGLGRFDEAKECYEALRELGENSAADQNLKKLHDIQEKDIRCGSFFEITENFVFFISENQYPKPATHPRKKKKQKK